MENNFEVIKNWSYNNYNEVRYKLEITSFDCYIVEIDSQEKRSYKFVTDNSNGYESEDVIRYNSYKEGNDWKEQEIPCDDLDYEVIKFLEDVRYMDEESEEQSEIYDLNY